MAARPVALFLAAAFLAGGAQAQIAKGSPAPAIPFQKVWNDGPASFDDFAGKVVILKFSETW
ncbi:MAG: hypothetical protein JNK15_18625 [Planctomycetes bacterium]|nr:hypothetical protein [Planctomycetota bacterium]